MVLAVLLAVATMPSSSNETSLLLVELLPLPPPLWPPLWPPAMLLLLLLLLLLLVVVLLLLLLLLAVAVAVAAAAAVAVAAMACSSIHTPRTLSHFLPLGARPFGLLKPPFPSGFTTCASLAACPPVF